VSEVARNSALPHYLVPEVPPAEVFEVAGAEAHHAAKVRRVRVGERICLTDGCGHWAEAEVVSEQRGSLTVRVRHRGFEPTPNPFVTVVQALLKGDRGVLAVEMLTELGVDRIVPWQSQRCVSVWRDDKQNKGSNRWQRVASEAAKQSRRVRVPQVGALAELPQVLTLAESALVLVCHESASTPITTVDLNGVDQVVIVVGPEGGISDSELQQLSAAGAQPVSLGQTVLRASTAGTAASAWVMGASGRWTGIPRGAQGTNVDGSAT